VEANLSSRLATAAVGIPLLIGLVGWAPSWMFTAFFLILTGAALREYFLIVFPGRCWDQCAGIVFGLALAGALLASEEQAFRIQLSLILLLGFCIYPFLGGDLETRLRRLLWTLLGGFYLGLLVPHWILLFHRPNGRAWVFFVMLIIMSGDSAAYFVGRRFGKIKLAPEISPGKTVEGAVAYLIGGILFGLIGAAYLFSNVSSVEALALSAALAILGQVGDLFESWVKRACAVKDSGGILPGHGGVLDRLDSLIFPAVFTTTYLGYFHS
jgi:phosphatidate cytidylyltransferase